MSTPVHHLTLTVTDPDASASWYQAVLGEATAVRREGPGWTRVRLAWPSGLIIGLTRHDGTPDAARFDHRAIGIDHIGLACADEAEVRGWVERLDAAGAVHGPLEDAPYGWAVTARDPDGIAVEFFAPKP